MPTKLKDILNIQPGTLIRGLHVNNSGSVCFSLKGWNLIQRKFIKGLWPPIDQEVFIFEYFPDVRVAELLTRKKLLIYENGNTTFSTLQQNGKTYYINVKRWTKQKQIVVGDCIGMSLGENFMAIQPSHAEMYRPNSYEVYLFHKVLHDGDIKWIILHSKTINKNKIILNPQMLLMDINMELS